MDFVQFTASVDDDNRRIDRVIKKLFPDMPLSLVYKNIRSGFIRINGAKAKTESRIQKGDTVCVSAVLCTRFHPRAEPVTDTKPVESPQTERATAASFLAPTARASTLHPDRAAPQYERPLQTVFCNEHILFINKPYGIPVQGAGKDGVSLDALVRSRYEESAHTASLSFRPGPLHRLDRNTTGLVAFSQSLRGAAMFSRAIKSRCITKTYLGIVCGTLDTEQTWIDYLKDAPNAGAAFYTVRAATSVSDTGTSDTNAKKAVTHAMPLSHGFYKERPVTLCRFVIETGRKHQIRFQSAHHGFHLVGDRAYKSPLVIEPAFKREYFLHASALDFTSLIKDENPLSLPPTLSAPLDETFSDFCALCALGFPK